jgi:hypothetical protein
VNQYSQFQGGQQGFQNQNQNQFQPTGFVQSHYQGQLSYPSFGQQTQSIVGGPGSQYGQSGYQQQTPAFQQSYTQQAGSNQSYTSHQPVQSHASSPATAFGNFGPVISHYGFQAGPDASQNQNQNQFNQSSQYQPAQSGFSSFSNAGFTGGFQNNANQNIGHSQVQSYTQQNPVYNATNAYQQDGPVIARLGYQANNSNTNFR